MAAAITLGNQVEAMEIGSAFMQQLSNQAVADDLLTLLGVTVALAWSGALRATISLDIPLAAALTAIVSLVLPEGYALVPASVVFPTANVLVAAVPEPASLAVLGFGLIGLVAVRRRRPR